MHANLNCLQKRKGRLGIGNIRIKTKTKFKKYGIYKSTTRISRKNNFTLLK